MRRADHVIVIRVQCRSHAWGERDQPPAHPAGGRGLSLRAIGC